MKDLPELFDLTGRVAIVAGGAGLLGTEFCRTLAESGAAVIIADINGGAAGKLASLFNKKGYSAQGQQVDVTSAESVQTMVTAAINAFGRVDILVNSAALDPKFDPHSQAEHSGSFEDYPLELWRKALDVNLTGVMLCCQAVSRQQ